jgi:membrane fusion protein (multidrug efflux system)
MHDQLQFRPLHATMVLLCLALLSCGGASAPPGSGAPKPIQVVVATTTTKPWSDVIEALGTARANESLTLSAKVTETVARVHFSDGDRVEAGQVLVSLTGRAEVAQLEEARAALKEATQQFGRQNGLVEQGTVPRSQLDAQIAVRDSARARMEAIRARLADRVITAPFAGVLGFRQVSEGTLVTPGTPIATLDDITVIKLDFSVPETLLGSLAVGQPIEARSAAFSDRVFDGTVSSIDSRVDPISRAVTVRARMPNEDARLRPGMLLSVSLSTAPRDAVVIPEIAVAALGARQFVYVVGDDQVAKQVVVRLGARRAGEVEVTEGLSVGQRVVTDGLVKMRDGAKVAIAAPPDGAVTS